MKTLIAARARKGIDQEAMSRNPYAEYIPIEDLRRWTGYGISPELGLNIITVYQCVRVLAETFAAMPLILYRRTANGGRDRAHGHPLYDVLHSQPNPDMTSFVWRELMMTHLATWGNAYCEKTEDALGRLQLWPIRPDRIEPKYEGGRRVYDYLNPLGGKQRMREGSVLHFQGMGSDGLKGKSPIELMRRALGLYQTAEQFGESFFRNGARPATVLKHPKTLSDPAIARLAAQMDSLRGAGNAGKTVVLEEGLDFGEVGIPPEDAQFLETRLFQKREIVGGFRIPPHKVGDLERATFSNIEHQSIEFIQDTMLPWFVRVEQDLATQVVEDDEVFAEFLVDGYLRGDAKTRNEAYAIRWQHGNLSPNEWRQKENDNPIEGGDAYYVPANYNRVDAAVEEAEDEAPADLTGVGMPMLTRVKSAEVRCPACHRKLAELATPPYRFTCTNPKCKTPVESAA